jgi:hypothetical protein
MAARHAGSCHCGAVRFAVESDLEQVIECNCTHCYRKGLQLTFVAPEQFTLLEGEDALSEHMFNRHNIHHLFCRSCGVQSFARGKRQDGAEMVAVNIRTLEDVAPWSVTTTHFDGLSR